MNEQREALLAELYKLYYIVSSSPDLLTQEVHDVLDQIHQRAHAFEKTPYLAKEVAREIKRAQITSADLPVGIR